MKRTIILLLLVLCTAATAFAYDFQSGDLYYNITSENTVEVTNQEGWSETNYQGLTTATIPETVTYDGTTYSVTSIGYEAFVYCSSLTSITIPNSVTSIENYAFSSCSSLTSITIPNSVTSIGGYAFSGCSSLPVVDNLRYADTYLVEAVDKSLSTYTIKAGTKWIGDYAFRDCFSLTSITIPNSVTSIGYEAFYNCSSLTSITLPNSVTSIGDEAFYECSALTTITIPNSVTSIGSRAFCSCSSLTSITIPNSVTSIGDEAFAYCYSLTSITIPNSVTSIGERAFEYVPNVVYNGTATGSPWGARSVNGYVDGYLVYADDTKTTLLACSVAATGEITIPNSVTSIGDSAFDGCSSLTSITIPNSVTSIRDWAFYGCSSLTSITIPNSVTSIGEVAFGECTSLTSITIPNSVTSIRKYAFSMCSSLTSIVVESGNTVYDSRNNCNAIIETATNTLITGCQSTTIPNSVTSIGFAAFYGCFSLTSITLPNSVTSIGDEAFYICSSLTSITLPNSVTSIGDAAFSDCSSLTSVTIPNSVTSIAFATFSSCTALASVTIPSSVTSIEEYAFYECSKLQDIYCYAATPPTAQTNSFANYNVYVHVPCASLEAYDMDAVFGSFKYIECIGSEDVVVPDDEVTVAPSYEDVTITWPSTDGAETYTLVITKDGVTFCTLVFNKQGQLVSIAFKPARQNAPASEGTTPANYAEQTANGFRFTVIGLNEGTAYAYTLTVRDAANSVLETYTGEFTTQSDTQMGIHESAGDNTPAGQTEKILQNGQVLILRNGKTYDMMGQRL